MEKAIFYHRDPIKTNNRINQLRTTLKNKTSCLQAKIQKHDSFEAEVLAHAKTIANLDKTGNGMIQHGHYASDIIKVRLFGTV